MRERVNGGWGRFYLFIFVPLAMFEMEAELVFLLSWRTLIGPVASHCRNCNLLNCSWYDLISERVKKDIYRKRKIYLCHIFMYFNNEFKWSIQFSMKICILILSRNCKYLVMYHAPCWCIVYRTRHLQAHFGLICDVICLLTFLRLWLNDLCCPSGRLLYLPSNYVI